MNIVITGASGFVGSVLSRELVSAGHHVTGLGTSRNHMLASREEFTWVRADTTRPGDWQTAVADADAVINLAGRTLFKRWTRAYKRQIVDSRVETTRNVADALAGSGAILLSTSAVGYYGDRGEEALTETSDPGADFLARLAVDWERAAYTAEKRGVRVAIMRFGVVLGRTGGALAQMLPAFRIFAGGPIGSGRQWFPWIHVADLTNAVRFLLETETASGAYNFCGPQVIRQKAFARALGKVLGRPALLPAPTLALRLMMGEMAGFLFASQKVVPQRLMDESFEFDFATVETALADLVRS